MYLFEASSDATDIVMSTQYINESCPRESAAITAFEFFYPRFTRHRSIERELKHPSCCCGAYAG